MHHFSALFGKEYHMFRIDLLSIVRSLNTVYTAIGICHASYRIFRPVRRTFLPEKCDLNLTCVLCAGGQYYFQTYKYPYSYYTAPLSWDSEICFQIMRPGITACERLTFL
jgi:hypothetical protein